MQALNSSSQDKSGLKEKVIFASRDIDLIVIQMLSQDGKPD